MQTFAPLAIETQSPGSPRVSSAQNGTNDNWGPGRLPETRAPFRFRALAFSYRKWGGEKKPAWGDGRNGHKGVGGYGVTKSRE